MTKAIKHEYRVQYVDNTYQIVELTKGEYKGIGESIEDDRKVWTNDDIMIRLTDIRAITYLPPVPEDEVAEDGSEVVTSPTDEQLTEWGFATPEERAYLREVMGMKGV